MSLMIILLVPDMDGDDDGYDACLDGADDDDGDDGEEGDCDCDAVIRGC